MTIQTSPNGITTREGDSAPIFEDLGTGNAAAINAAIAAIPAGERNASTWLADITDNNAVTLLLPARPVGFDLYLNIRGAAGTSFIIQETDQLGVARALSSRRGGGAAEAFASFAPTVGGVAGGGAGSGGKALNTLTAGTFLFATTGGQQLLHFKKIRANQANVADGWMLVNATRQGA